MQEYSLCAPFNCARLSWTVCPPPLLVYECSTAPRAKHHFFTAHFAPPPPVALSVLPQIRRYVYCDVIRAVDINPHVDTTGVQNYIINQAKVMFLNHRPHSKPGKPGAPDTCRTCRRHLREGYLFCSLACKVR